MLCASLCWSIGGGYKYVFPCRCQLAEQGEQSILHINVGLPLLNCRASMFTNLHYRLSMGLLIFSPILDSPVWLYFKFEPFLGDLLYLSSSSQVWFSYLWRRRAWPLFFFFFCKTKRSERGRPAWLPFLGITIRALTLLGNVWCRATTKLSQPLPSTLGVTLRPHTTLVSMLPRPHQSSRRISAKGLTNSCTHVQALRLILKLFELAAVSFLEPKTCGTWG